MSLSENFKKKAALVINAPEKSVLVTSNKIVLTSVKFVIVDSFGTDIYLPSLSKNSYLGIDECKSITIKSVNRDANHRLFAAHSDTFNNCIYDFYDFNGCCTILLYSHNKTWYTTFIAE